MIHTLHYILTSLHTIQNRSFVTICMSTTYSQREIQLLSLARRASDQDSGVLCVSTEDTGGDGSNRGSESPTTTPPLHDTVTTESGGGDENGGGGGGKNEGENDEGKGGIGDEERAGGEEETGAPPAQRKKTVKIADVQEIEL